MLVCLFNNMTNEATLTVDSLHAFKYKKRFSFANKSASNTKLNDEKEEFDQSEQVSDNSDSEARTKSPNKKSSQLKGTAKLKQSSDESDSNNERANSEKKKKKK